MERDAKASAAYRDAKLLLIGGGGLVVVISAALGWLLSRSIARPVSRMNLLAQGDTSIQPPHVGRGDDIGRMAGVGEVFEDSMISVAT